MQSAGPISNGEREDTLHERKPHHPTLESPQDVHREDESDAAEDPMKEKKTFGRTPDGVGKSDFSPSILQ